MQWEIWMNMQCDFFLVAALTTAAAALSQTATPAVGPAESAEDTRVLLQQDR
jgi:hypothetical protein